MIPSLCCDPDCAFSFPGISFSRNWICRARQAHCFCRDLASYVAVTSKNGKGIKWQFWKIDLILFGRTDKWSLLFVAVYLSVKEVLYCSHWTLEPWQPNTMTDKVRNARFPRLGPKAVGNPRLVKWFVCFVEAWGWVSDCVHTVTSELSEQNYGLNLCTKLPLGPGFYDCSCSQAWNILMVSCLWVVTDSTGASRSIRKTNSKQNSFKLTDFG